MTKIETAVKEYVDWCALIGIRNLDDLRNVMDSGMTASLITVCEARQERSYAEIANHIAWGKNERPLVMLSGPSSSGKTSTSKRLAVQSFVLGVVPKVIELDNYFVNRDKTPLDENGQYDFECLGAMDVDLLNSNLNDLIAGKEVELPKFDFVNGRRVYDGTRMKLEKGDVLFMEGIHALNPALTPSVDPKKIFKIYVSALTSLPGGEKDHNSTTDKRLLRRMVRDNRTRGITPEETILRWPSVRAGEIRNIFPYEDNADVVFNSSTLYDLPVLKRFASPLLESVGKDSPAFEKASSLLTFMEKVRALSDEDIKAIPPSSVMREFIGGQIL